MSHVCLISLSKCFMLVYILLLLLFVIYYLYSVQCTLMLQPVLFYRCCLLFVVCELFCHDYDIVSVSFPFWSCTIYNICEICHCYSCIYLVIFPVYIMQCVTCSLCTCLFSVITGVVYNAGFSSDGFWRCGIKVKFEWGFESNRFL